MYSSGSNNCGPSQGLHFFRGAYLATLAFTPGEPLQSATRFRIVLTLLWAPQKFVDDPKP